MLHYFYFRILLNIQCCSIWQCWVPNKYYASWGCSRNLFHRIWMFQQRWCCIWKLCKWIWSLLFHKVMYFFNIFITNFLIIISWLSLQSWWNQLWRHNKQCKYDTDYRSSINYIEMSWLFFKHHSSLTLWDKGLSYIISSFKFFDFGLSLKYQNQY